MKRTAKCAVAEILRDTGLLRILVRRRLSNRAVVLTYHRVMSRDHRPRSMSHPGIIVDPETFDAHLGALKRHFSVLSLAEFQAHCVEKRPFAAPSCLITFDDGWLDVFTEAWPLLQRHQLPAVVFLPVDCLGRERPFWQEQVGALLLEVWTQRAPREAFGHSSREVLGRHGLAHVLDAPASSVREVIQEAVTSLKAVGDPDRRRLIDEIMHLLTLDPTLRTSPDRLVSWEHVRTMAAAGIEFGSHGATHRVLTRLGPADVGDEVVRSIDVLRSAVPGSAAAFSYPNGDFDPGVVEQVRRAGYAVAFSTRPGAVSADDDRWTLRRINVSEGGARTPAMLLARILGLF